MGRSPYCHKTDISYPHCDKCGGIIVPSKTKAEERLIKQSITLYKELVPAIEHHGEPRLLVPFCKAIKAVLEEKKKK